MTLEDPFFVVKDEVFKALNKTRGLYLRWLELGDASSGPNGPEAEWTTTELRNSLRSIEWDLEDLEDTICIVEKNAAKFKIDNKELSNRKSFIDSTREEVKVMKDKMNMNRNRECDGTARQPLLESPGGSPPWAATPKYAKYARLGQADSPRRYGDRYEDDERYVGDVRAAQQKMLDAQDEQLHVISSSVGSLKTVSRQIGLELDEQTVMLDDFNTELENTDSKLDSTMKKVAKVLHMTNDRRQWLAIGILFGILFIVIILFIVM